MARSRRESPPMRTARALATLAVLAVAPLCALAASYATHYDPVGEKVYSAGQLGRMVPIAILIGGLTVAWAISRVRRKARHGAH